jgi:CelD/BcsL family acetyltransferase involved in cellulose biosynthesis
VYHLPLPVQRAAPHPLPQAAEIRRAAQSPALTLETLATEGAFLALREEWNAVVTADRTSNVFLRHEWFDAAWQWRRTGATLHTLVARRDGALAGAMPLLRTLRRTETGRRRVLEFLTVPDTQFCDILAPAHDAAAVAECFARAIAGQSGDWDMLELGYLAENAIAATAFADALRRSGCTVEIAPAGSNPYIALDSTWDAYYGARSRSLKKASNLALNRVAKSGTPMVDWHRPADGATVDPMLASIVDVSSRSWKRTTGNALDQAGPGAFIRRLSVLAAEREWLSVWTLALDGKPIAMEYQLVFGGQVHALRSDFDAAYGEISPGSYLNRVLLERLFSGEFARYYMGPGDNAYKLRWAEGSAALSKLTAYSRGPRGRFAALVDLRLKPLARAIRDRVRPPPPTRGED